MAEFPVHTMESAPEEAHESLEAAQEEFGFLPNLLGELAGAPPVLDAYMTMSGLLEDTSFEPVEQQLIITAASVENDCEYCVAAHSAGLEQSGMAEDQIEAVREGRTLEDERLEALRRFTTAVVRERGHVSEEAIQRFLDAGFRREQVFEVILGVAMKTLSNYTNHIAGTPLDEPLKEYAWKGTRAARAGGTA